VPRIGNKGSEGLDWKCLKVPGLPNEGVGGMASLICCREGFIEAGVRIVRPRLLGFRLGGDGGLTKDGDMIAGSDSMFCESGKLVVDDARPGVREVFTARFLRLRPFFGGAAFWSSKKGAVCSCEVRGRNMPVLNEFGGGDSGEEPGEGSVALESSMVEQVVVGEESFEVALESLML
jgi:hypothetical protein